MGVAENVPLGWGYCVLQGFTQHHSWLIPTLVSVFVGLLREVGSWWFPAGELSFLLKCLRGPQSKEEHLAALASWGPSSYWISRASAMLKKCFPEATSCLYTAGKSAAPCSFILKL